MLTPRLPTPIGTGTGAWRVKGPFVKVPSGFGEKAPGGPAGPKNPSPGADGALSRLPFVGLPADTSAENKAGKRYRELWQERR